MTSNSTDSNAWCADLDWQNAAPFSKQFNDVYFSRDNGLAETRHVFLQQNYLAERFAALKSNQSFVIGETGFGTGLNVLCTWQLFLQVAPNTARLQIVSIEKYPLSPAHLQQALALWPELSAPAAELLQQYTWLTQGWHRFSFAQGRVQLTLCVGDVASVLPEIDAHIDAWFLDGFAPSKNPEMWQPVVFNELARLSKPQATLATFTAAGEVRRGLQAAGFAMEKVAGYGRKREMLRGTYCNASAHAAAPFSDSALSSRGASFTPRSAYVIGAGIAGAALARALAERGVAVTVCDRAQQAGAGASGNPMGVLYPRLSHKDSAVAQFIRQGWQHSVRHLQYTLPSNASQPTVEWHRSGVLQLAFDDGEQERIALLAKRPDFGAIGQVVSAVEASAIAGIDLAVGGLWLPSSGWVVPPDWCHSLLQHPNIVCAWGVEATIAMARAAMQQGHLVVICTAHEISLFPALMHLPIQKLRGQISRLPATSASQMLNTVLCAAGYVGPVQDGWHTFGASFERTRTDCEPSLIEHRQNLQMLAQLSPQLYAALGGQALQPEQMQGRVGLRATSPDFLPMLGQLYDPETQAPIYVSLAHGARGLISAPLAAEILCAELFSEPSPVPRQVRLATQVARFSKREALQRKMKRSDL